MQGQMHVQLTELTLPYRLLAIFSANFTPFSGRACFFLTAC